MSIGPRLGHGRTAELFAWGDDQVLKLFHAGVPRARAEHEAGVSRAVHEAGVASPAVGGIVEVSGRPGIIYERISGPSMLEAVSARPWRLLRLARLLAELQAGMHACLAPELPLQRQRLRDRIGGTALLTAAGREAALRALEQLPTGSALCHGDFHPDNILLSPRGPVVIDWPDATQGHPLADVARSSLLLRLGAPPAGRASRLLLAARRWFHHLYLRRYLELRPASRQELAAWQLPVAAARLSERIPEEQAEVLAIVERCLPR